VTDPDRPRALALRALGLGDLLAGVPALRAVRRALPEHELSLAAPAVLQPLVELVEAVDRLVPSGELQPVPWSGPPPEVAVDLHGNGPASKEVLAALAPGDLVAFAGPGGPSSAGALVPGPAWDPEEHERVRWCRLVAWAWGGDHDPDDVRLRRPDLPPTRPGAVVVHPGAASGSRRWWPERFAEVAAALAADGHEVLVTGSGSERPLAVAVAARAGLDPSAVLAGTTDLRELAALVADAGLVVCGDTGAAHLASAYATPSVVLFGPTPPHRWGPPLGGPHTVLWHPAPGDPAGDPHGTSIDPALARVGVPEVIAAARALLGPGAAGLRRRGVRPGRVPRPSTAGCD
jgi:ADP-heptose:LPS heptosyltransferase